MLATGRTTNPKTGLKACLGFGLFLTALSVADAAVPAFPAPKAAGPALPDRPMVFWLQPSPTGCAWSLYDPAQGQTRKLIETPTCPSRILWDRSGRRAFYERDGRVWELAWDGLAQPRDQGSTAMPMTVPAGVEADSATDIVWWISHTTGRLRAGRSLPLVGEDEVGDEAPLTVEYEGRPYPMAPLPSVVRHPIVGAQITAIALVWELSPQGQWERIAARGTRIGFPPMDTCDDATCGGHYLKRERLRFRDGLYAVADAHDPRFGELDPVRSAVAAECDVSGRCKPDDLNLDERTRVLLDITSISNHDLVGARVALCFFPPRLRHRAFDESKCAGLIELVPSSVPWSPALQRSGPYGLLVDSRNASRPLLVTAGKLQVVWSAPNGKLATWLPWRELWQLAR